MNKVRVVMGSILGTILFVPTVICTIIVAVFGLAAAIMMLAVIFTLPEKQERFGGPKKKWTYKGVKYYDDTRN